MMSKVAVLMRKAPYGSVYTAEGFRAVMGIGIFEMDVALAFVDDGVYALVKDQDPDKLDMQPLARVRRRRVLHPPAFFGGTRTVG
jgi:tRNA 2-thiouridine synthesizing protein C